LQRGSRSPAQPSTPRARFHWPVFRCPSLAGFDRPPRIDLLANRVEAEVGVAFFVACYSAMRKAPVTQGLLVLGDMSVQGNIKPLRSLTEPLQVAKDNGAKRALIPIENKWNFLDVSADIMEQVDPIFFGDPKTAAMKVLGLT